MSEMHDTSKLDDLIVTLIDSVKGYEHSAEKAEAARYRDVFLAMAHERRAAVERLQAASRAEGGSPADYGSAAATLHRRVEDLRVAFGGGDEAVVKAVEHGENYLKEEFDRALDDKRLSPAALDAVREAYASVRRGHDRATALKHALEAAD
ncbi:MAG TPA: PA2169 family four-helix-bundle protein [Allosphingosinicella sp.]|nr:PA2169 family four-helix-bundle protein [Allosphingosinicella sp.]